MLISAWPFLICVHWAQTNFSFVMFLTPLIIPGNRRTQSQFSLLHGFQFSAEQHGADKTGLSECNWWPQNWTDNERRITAIGADDEPNYAIRNWHSVPIDRCTATIWVCERFRLDAHAKEKIFSKFLPFFTNWNSSKVQNIHKKQNQNNFYR